MADRHDSSPSRGPKARSRSRHTLWIAAAVILIAAIAYFALFTRTPDEGTRVDDPSQLTEQPAQ
ncbi:hypothetical protein [Jiella pelagia]|uniref:Uncharacterized protein n=1 Tax=Jiella pelagia TaxID=2986949 RepID=A0ABY7C1H0_9HYPH|nr:hypothetical protein [Jiella pelagia]WAP68710.1 hypothetical protein OH818_26225 [Jiella pelagia]